MACDEHDWFFDRPCPGCAAAAGVTAAVTENSEPEIPPSVFDPGSDPGEIPEFLRRNPDNTFVVTERWSEPSGLAPVVLVVEKPEDLSDEQLHAKLYMEMPILDRQQYLQEANRRESKRRAYARLDKAGFRTAKGTDEAPAPEPETGDDDLL